MEPASKLTTGTTGNHSQCCDAVLPSLGTCQILVATTLAEPPLEQPARDTIVEVQWTDLPAPMEVTGAVLLSANPWLAAPPFRFGSAY
jgi:hypothetical protein